MDVNDGDWLDRRRRYRRLCYFVLGAGIAGFVIAERFGAPLLGVGVYWAGVVAFFGVRRGSPVALFDERDRALERRASHDALRVAGVALVVLAPGTAALEAAGYYDAPAVVEGALLGYAALFLIFGIAYLARRYGP
jgi:uncharacterized membrane protein